MQQGGKNNLFFGETFLTLEGLEKNAIMYYMAKLLSAVWVTCKPLASPRFQANPEGGGGRRRRAISGVSEVFESDSASLLAVDVTC